MKKSTEHMLLVILVLVPAMSLLAVPVMAQDVIKIGAIYSLTGPAAPVAKLQKAATEMAIKEVNAAGGVNIGGKKMQLEPIFCDDQSKAETATALFKDMVKKRGVTAMLGGTLAHVPLALNTAIKSDPVFYIATCAVPDAFHQKGVKAPTALGILGGASDIGRSGAAFLVEKLKPKKVAGFIPAYAFGNAVASGFESVMKKYPQVQYKIFWHPLGSSDMKRDLEAVRDFKPDVIAMASFDKDAVNALNEAFKMGLGKQAKLFHLWLLDSVGVAVPPDALKGVWAQMFWYHDMTGLQDEAVLKTTNEFVSTYGKAYGEPPDPFALPAYFAVKEIVRAMESAQSTDPAKMYEALMANPVWTGAKGEAKWRKDGRCMYKYSFAIVEGKGPADRKAGTFDIKYDFAKLVEAVSGKAFTPTLNELGY